VGVSAKASPPAESFLRFLESADGRAIFERYGFQ
jgi:ABC-type molybdate transport system substrate-binding protein